MTERQRHPERESPPSAPRPDGYDDEPHRPPLMTRLRHALLGRRTAQTDAVASVGRNLASWSMLRAPHRTPFDEPPTEPVELDPDEVPWELRDDER